ncbi:hypothetical protein BCF44_12675 [Kutzneria buriramensis]|uniref:Secreted protein n=2 Tax=Kutzneria buriramensis TaxID=1045776 RepID=A0A3E0GWT5_9PSEU|nr:hypothetical protein BCF44_12675 [Kutzneria buriramensis]
MKRISAIGIAVLAGSALLLLVPAEPAEADGPGGQIVVTPGDQTGAFELPSVGVGATSPGRPGSSAQAASTSQANSPGAEGDAASPQDPGPGVPCMYDYAGGMEAYNEACVRPHVAEGAQQPSANQLAIQAYRQLALPRPVPHFSPDVTTPSGPATIIGEHTWLWTDKNTWALQSKRVQAGAVWAEVTAMATKLMFNSGAGRSISCPGPGTVYTTAAGLHVPSPDCDYVFDEPSARVDAMFAIQWTVRWTGSTGTAPVGGSLPDMTSRAAAGFAVVEIQALNAS